MTDRTEETPKKKKSWLPWLGLFAVAYILSPIDLIPDLAPGIGWADDAFVTLAALVTGAVQRKKAMEASKATVEVA